MRVLHVSKLYAMYGTDSEDVDMGEWGEGEGEGEGCD